MQKKILLAVDHTRPSKNAMAYAVELASRTSDLHFVLFHVQPIISSFLQQEARRSAKAKRQLTSLLERNEQAAGRLLESYRQDMIGKGIPTERITSITRKRDLGFAKDIMELGLNGQYDAIVVGRRGLSLLAESCAGSVTSDILEQSQVIPVWLVDGKVPAGEILVAVDGSEASLRAVDHVGFMLSNSPDIKLTLLNVTGNAQKYHDGSLPEEANAELEEILARGEKIRIEQFFAHAGEKLTNAGLAGEQIRLESIKGRRRVGKAILDFARQGAFGTIVVGRRGIDTSFFMGSVSRHLINKLAQRALWMVP